MRLNFNCKDLEYLLCGANTFASLFVYKLGRMHFIYYLRGGLFHINGERTVKFSTESLVFKEQKILAYNDSHLVCMNRGNKGITKQGNPNG